MPEQKKPTAAELAREAQRIAAPRPMVGPGKLVIPPAKLEPPRRQPPPLPIAPPVVDEKTQTDGMLGPSPGSIESTYKNFPPPPQQAPQAPQSAPTRSLSPPPTSTAFQVKSGDVDFRVSKGTWARVRPYVLWLVIPLGGALLGYYQGLKAAGARMRADEAKVAALASEVAELRATHDAKLDGMAKALAREGVLTADHDKRLNLLEPKHDALDLRVQKIADQKGLTVKPSP